MENMDLNGLKKSIEHLFEIGCDGSEPVLIVLSEASVGARASCGINGIYRGFDWENGEIRISTDKDIISKKKDRDNPMPVKIKEYDYNSNRKTIIRKCPVCENHCKKDAKYCDNCGQRIIID